MYVSFRLLSQEEVEGLPSAAAEGAAHPTRVDLPRRPALRQAAPLLGLLPRATTPHRHRSRRLRWKQHDVIRVESHADGARR